MIFQLVAKLISGEAGIYIARMRRLAGLYAAMLVFLLLMIGFLIGALFVYIAGLIGSLYAALVFAGFFFLLILMTWILSIAARRPPPKRADDRLQRDIASIAGVTAISNLPLILGAVKKRKSLLLIPVGMAGMFATWRTISAFRRNRDQDWY